MVVSPSNRLVIFAKSPIAGHVKTRLQPLLTPQQSAQLQQCLVMHCLQAVISDAATYSVELWIDSDHDFWSSLQQRFGLALHYQQGEDLGERMAHALGDALTRASHAVVIGTDCPFIDVSYVESAFRAAITSDVVVGPAEDGGYVLLGLSRVDRALFKQVAWGSAEVLVQTLKRAHAEGLSCEQLPMLMDIDRPEDYARLQQLMPDLVAAV